MEYLILLIIFLIAMAYALSDLLHAITMHLKTSKKLIELLRE